MKCAVIGGKGFVGSAVAAEGRARGHSISIIDVEEYEACVGNVYDVLINANGNSRKYLARKAPVEEFRRSVESVMRVLHDFSARKYVHLSTIDVYPDCSHPDHNTESTVIDSSKLSPYGLHKYLAEQLCRYYADRWIIFRMAGFVGPGLWKNSIYDLLTDQPLRVHPDSEYQYLHTRELARIIFSVIESDVSEEIFNVAGDGTVSLRSVAEMIPDCTLRMYSEDVEKERYEVNIEKIKRHRNPPKTIEAVSRFIEAVAQGEEPLA